MKTLCNPFSLFSSKPETVIVQGPTPAEDAAAAAEAQAAATRKERADAAKRRGRLRTLLTNATNVSELNTSKTTLLGTS